MNALRFYIQTFGCQMNDHDSETLAGLLVHSGHYQVDGPDEADMILLNTCAIREKAEQKVYSQLGRYKKLKDANPALILGVGGCMAQGTGRKVMSRAPYVDMVFGTQTIHEVPLLVEEVGRRRRKIVSTEMTNDPATMKSLYSNVKANGPKAFVTVMQGCDNWCAYCVVPSVRGRELSRPVGEIVEEVRMLADQGVAEVTLLGQNVNSFGRGSVEGINFPELVRRVATVEGIKRVRFTTNHPKDLSEELIKLFGEEPKVAAHIHLPVQSGSDRIIKAMNRHYTVAHYLSLVDKLRRAKSSIAITTDMIVGFPGETEADFEATMKLMERVRFDGMFSFKYSPRPNTKAEKYDEQVAEPVKEERLARLQELQKGHTLEKNRECVGRQYELLVEGVSKTGEGQLMGRTSSNRIVNFSGSDKLVGTMAHVRVTDAWINSMVGELV